MISPVTNEEKQKVLETVTNENKTKTLSNIIRFYLHETDAQTKPFNKLIWTCSLSQRNQHYF